MDTAIPQDRISERIREHVEVDQVVWFIPQEPAHRTEDQIADVPTHQMQESVFKVITVVPQERTSERNFEQLIDDTWLKVPRVFVSECSFQQNVDVPPPFHPSYSVNAHFCTRR